MNKQEIEKAIELLQTVNHNLKIEHMTKDVPDGTTNEERKEYRGDFRLINVAISALEKQLNDGWISVTERLPENNKHESGELIEFNVMLRYGAVATTGCIDNDGAWGWMDWCKFKFNPFGVDVLYWQPLPELYKEVSE